MLRLGVIGLGFMGATHVRSARAAADDGVPVQLVAVADPRPQRRAGDLAGAGGNIDTESDLHHAFEPHEVRGYATSDELLEQIDVDAVVIATPTDTHADLAIRAMRAGKHVLLEKPVATNSQAVAEILTVARETRLLCMPAMCMRFWPAWAWLKQRIQNQSFGRVRSASFTRLAARPNWSPAFYNDPNRTGGALFDLHIHDADFVRYCFGDPQSLFAAGNIDDAGCIHALTVAYRFADGPDHVVAQAGWDHAAGFDFRMRFVVNFDEATADFDLTRAQPLLLCREGRAEVVELDVLSGYDLELRHFVRCCISQRALDVVTLDDALAVTKLLEATRQSVVRHEIVTL